jgi:uncharacterized protein (DUF952 family)
MVQIIYKILTGDQWSEMQSLGVFNGAPVDLADGFIHFSAAGQLRETAARHFSGRDGLVLVSVEADVLGDALRWEVSRGGDKFPHLYAALPLSGVVSVWELNPGSDGMLEFPPEIPR